MKNESRLLRTAKVNARKNVHVQKKGNSTDKEYPTFSFKHFDDRSDCHKGLSVSNWSYAFHDLFRLSKITWEIIKKSDHTKNGYEIISRSSLRMELPLSVSDGENLFCFRIAGQEGRMIGYREDAIFHVIFLDFSPFVVYRH